MIRKINFEDQEQLDLFETDLQKPVDDGRPDFELDAQSNQLQDRRTHYSPELVEKAMILFGRGVSYKTVANSLAIPVYTAREWRHRYRNHTLSQHVEGQVSKGRYPVAVKEQVVRMRVELGMSYNRIVQETGISRATIRSWLSDVGNEDKDSEAGQNMIDVLIK